jgi:hypothetical protein
MILQRLIVCGLVLVCSTAANAALVHRYSFASDASDSIGGAHGTVVDPGAATAVFGSGVLDVSANTGQGSNGITEDAYVNLPNGIVTAAANGGVAGQLTLEIWAQSAENRNWAALISAGTSNGGEDQSPAGNMADYIQMIPQNGANGLIRTTTHAANVGAEGFVDFSSAMSTTQKTHLVSVYDQSGGLPGTVTLYVDGALVGSAAIATGLNIGTMTDNNNWLGRSQWNDPVFDGSYDEFRIYNTALDATAVATSFQRGPDFIPEPASLFAMALAGCVLAAAWRHRRAASGLVR